MPLCELCSLYRLTTWYYQNEDFVVLDCKTCDNIMAVTKAHTMTISPDLAVRMIALLYTIADDQYGVDRWKIRTEQKTCKDHLHWHIEPILKEQNDA